MQAHPHADRPGLERALAVEGGRGGAGRGREGDEERVALRVDLDAAVRREGGAQDAPVLGERLRVALGAERVQQPRRALDVGEEERDGAVRAARQRTASRGY